MGKFCRAAVGAGGSIALLALIGCVTAPRTPEERAADANVKAEVETALNTDARIYARHVDVKVDRGVVYLGGFVWSDSELLFARADAASVPGVRAVADEMELLRGGISGGASR